MYENEDAQFWESEALDALAWLRVARAVRTDIRRRKPSNRWELIDDLYRADDLLWSKYHYATMRAQLVHGGFTMAEMHAA